MMNIADFYCTRRGQIVPLTTILHQPRRMSMAEERLSDDTITLPLPTGWTPQSGAPAQVTA